MDSKIRHESEVPGRSKTLMMMRRVPVFPLPNTVFFPKTVLPLHVFEPRYRQMVQDATDGDGLIVVAMNTGPSFKDLGTVGRIRDLEPLGDGRFNLRLEGLERVSLVEVPVETPYRQVRVEPRKESLGTNDASAIAEARLELLAAYGMLRSIAGKNEPLALRPDLPFEIVVNTTCAGLPIEAALRQRLLAQDTLLGRKRVGMEYISAVTEAMSWLRVLEGRGDTMTN